MHIDKKEKQAVWSCRAPLYFSIIKMLDTIWTKHKLLERYGWHAQAGWLTCKLDNLDKFKEAVYKYWEKILPNDLEKINFLDTKILEKDLLEDEIKKIFLLAPFWEKNKEPVFLLENIKIKKIDLVWKQKNHVKIYGQLGQVEIILIKWSWLNLLEKIKWKQTISVVVNIEKDNFNWWYFFKIKELVE